METPPRRLPDRHAQPRGQMPSTDASRRPREPSSTPVGTLPVVFVVASLLNDLWQAVVLTFLGQAIILPSLRWVGCGVPAVWADASPKRGVLLWVEPWWPATRNGRRPCTAEDSEPPSVFRPGESFTITRVRTAFFDRLVLTVVLRAASFSTAFPCVTALRRATALAVALALVTVTVVRDDRLEEASERLQVEGRSLATGPVTIGNRGERGQSTGEERRPEGEPGRARDRADAFRNRL